MLVGKGGDNSGDVKHFRARQLIGRALGRKRHIDQEEAAYIRLAAKGFQPDGIIDVGAYQGEWTRLARSIFPKAPVLMIEAQEAKKPYLDAVCAEMAGTRYASTVLGAASGEVVTFYEMETGSSFLPEQSNAPRVEKRLVTRTLDEVAGELLPGPASLFLKIDVQGAELQVLAGGEETLARSEVVQLEVAMLPYNKGAPTMLEVISYMDDRELVPFDISGSSRPNGCDLVQIDILFTRRGSALRPDYFAF